MPYRQDRQRAATGSGEAARLAVGVTPIAILFAAACGSDSASVDAASVDGAPDAFFNRFQRGVVSLQTGDSSTGVAAGFYQAAAGAGCSWTFDGACALTVCDENHGLIPLSAGDLTITADTVNFTATPLLDGSYSFPVLGAIPVGQTVTVSAVGAAVPAFTTTVTVPPPPEITAPVFGALTIDTSAPLALAWTPQPDPIYVFLHAEVPDAVSIPFPERIGETLHCVFPGDAGAGQIPASVLAAFSSRAEATLATASIQLQELEAGEHDILVRAYALALVWFARVS